MYIPSYFAETDRETLHAFIERHNFGVLVSQCGGEPFATHLPFLLERDNGPQGTLLGHVAKANLHWQELSGQTGLAIFSGPHAYISPTWYEAENVVPTWNYAAVHAYGKVEVLQEAQHLRAIVQALVTTYESSLPQPWKLEHSSAFIDKLLGQIVGFRIVIERLEGKFKLNQNQPAERREKVIQQLQNRGSHEELAVAALMEEQRGEASG